MRIAPIVLVAALIAACSSPDAKPADGTLTFTPSLGVDLKTMQKTPGGAWYKDLVQGAGAPIAQGQRALIHYDGHLPDGQRFDQNGPTDVPFGFHLGTGEVVRGFDEGVAGMRIGGKRLVVIPPELGYGAQGAPPAVPPNATLVFTIELVSIQ